MTQTAQISALATRVGTEFKNYLPKSGTAAKANADSQGNVFSDYYATKAALEALVAQVSKEDEDYGDVTGEPSDVDYGSI